MDRLLSLRSFEANSMPDDSTSTLYHSINENSLSDDIDDDSQNQNVADLIPGTASAELVERDALPNNSSRNIVNVIAGTEAIERSLSSNSNSFTTIVVAANSIATTRQSIPATVTMNRENFNHASDIVRLPANATVDNLIRNFRRRTVLSSVQQNVVEQRGNGAPKVHQVAVDRFHRRRISGSRRNNMTIGHDTTDSSLANFICHICKISLPTRSSLTVHKKSHLTNCKYCDRSFKKAIALTNHLKENCEKIPPLVRRKFLIKEYASLRV